MMQHYYCSTILLVLVANLWGHYYYYYGCCHAFLMPHSHSRMVTGTAAAAANNFHRTNHVVQHQHNRVHPHSFSSSSSSLSSSSLVTTTTTTTTSSTSLFQSTLQNNHDDDDDDNTLENEVMRNEETTTTTTNEKINLPLILRPTNYLIEPLTLRIGHGFDIHRLVPYQEAGQPIIIGGTIITHENQNWLDVSGQYHPNNLPNTIYSTQLGVLAHSDGDVIYHSIVDAIFGALTLPDIGQVFQDTDALWKGCDSSKFMQVAYQVLQYYQYQIGNIDVTLILERPKVANFKKQMKENIVRLLHTTEGRVNIKARTHERLDSVGELRAVSCHVVVTLEKKGVYDKEG